MEEKEEYKNCLMCGDQGESIKLKNGLFLPMCPNPECLLHSLEATFALESDAIQAWNK